MEYVEPIRDISQLQALESYIKENYHQKYYVMFMLGIYSGLRISDILRLRVSDIKKNNQIVSKVTVRAKKTNKNHIFPINQKLKVILKEYCKELKDYDYLIYSSNNRKNKAIDRRQAWRVLKQSSEYIGIGNIGTHSMRKTYGYHFYKKTNNIAYLQEIFGHAHPSVTLKYIGVVQEDILKAMQDFDYY